MKKSKEEIQLITDWLRLAQENLQVALSTYSKVRDWKIHNEFFQKR